jgi:mannose/cellobiose epimerase-like protein (N-acyl-D-glucosamine 2-epimerase family)
MDVPADARAGLGACWSTWFAERALPFWRERGLRPDGRLFLERLHLDGTPDLGADLRVRTQARQIYVFATATTLGLDDRGAALARSMLAPLTAAARSPDGKPGWVHVLDADGGVRDARRDLYDHAFVLLMYAALLANGPDRELRRELEVTLGAIDTLFEAPHGGYAETATGGLPRRQNPHMHLFEAFLALFEATGEARFLARAGELLGLFRTRFVDDERDLVREFFAADWSLLPDGSSDVVEPGHMMEWVWLLRRYQRLTASPLEALQARLFRQGERLGREADGFLIDSTDPAGGSRADSRRLWVQTEYLKALLVRARAGDPAAPRSRATALSEALFRTYLGVEPVGTWHDRFTRDGRLAVDHIPASTLYHLIGVVAELLATDPVDGR